MRERGQQPLIHSAVTDRAEIARTTSEIQGRVASVGAWREHSPLGNDDRRFQNREFRSAELPGTVHGVTRLPCLPLLVSSNIWQHFRCYSFEEVFAEWDAS